MPRKVAHPNKIRPRKTCKNCGDKFFQHNELYQPAPQNPLVCVACYRTENNLVLSTGAPKEG